MIKMFPKYYDVNDWKILDSMTVHAYNDNETPIDIVKVQIGAVERCEVDFRYHYSATTFPIIRWITKKAYEDFNKAGDIIVW